MAILQNINKSKLFYLTTPIFYVNAGKFHQSFQFIQNKKRNFFKFFSITAPHIGHLYSASIADCIFRYEKLRDRSSKLLFSTGTDEHGTKIQQAASLHNQKPEQYCDKITECYKTLFAKTNISYTHFNRTTDKIRHFPAVQHFWVSFINNLDSECHLYVFFLYFLERTSSKRLHLQSKLRGLVLCIR